MMRRKGFTLLELLVVVAIIGVLSAMLFPMFARAREVSRADNCLGNVRAIAVAIQMYAADYGALFPDEHQERMIDYFNTAPGADHGGYPSVCSRASKANPYLRAAVVLKDYLPDRRVWQCPDAPVMSQAAWIVPPGPDGDWLQNYIDHQGEWGLSGPGGGSGIPSAMGPCHFAFPSDWGGAITDSFLQGGNQSLILAVFPGPQGGAFAQGIGTNENLVELTRAEISQPGRYISCGDCGKHFEITSVQDMVFPDTCRATYCGTWGCLLTCASADWGNCPWSQDCGITYGEMELLLNEGMNLRAYTRHHGGSNIGFLDGHAKWCAAELLMTRSEPFPKPIFEGLYSYWPSDTEAE